ncbi:MAG: 4-alpha-glucanotransferase [Syntrophobacteraceae bacterium]
MKLRKSGILLHITSLPSEFGIGDLGGGAYEFADFLADAGQAVWQVLPFSPSSSACGHSPYCGYSAFAGNPLLIGLDLLVREGFISEADLCRLPPFSPHRTDYGAAERFKRQVLGIAFEKFRTMPDHECRFANFLRENAHWLDDYALFTALKERFGGAAWNEWPHDIRNREEGALRGWERELEDRTWREKFHQFLFFGQWSALKAHCNEKNIQIMGDLPIYVGYDSSDVWSNPQFFKLDEEKKPLFVAGVPPDYFSDTGQLWGNPVYAWDNLKDDSFSWWIRRMEHNLKYLDMVRLDHFRGFVAYWEVPASEKTAVNGAWVKAPVRDFFDALLRRFPFLPIIAEDLGVITPDVKETMTLYGFPGMKLLHFAFGGDASTNPYIPHNHVRNCVVYTGTHDNNTTRGWFEHDLSDQEKETLASYLGREIDETNAARELVRFALMSVAGTAIIPMQDHLDLGADARMNTPSTTFGNWEWRLAADQLTPALAESILEMTKLYGRV